MSDYSKRWDDEEKSINEQIVFAKKYLTTDKIREYGIKAQDAFFKHKKLGCKSITMELGRTSLTNEYYIYSFRCTNCEWDYCKMRLKNESLQ